VASPIYSYQQVASTTSKLEQIVMLYDGAIKFLLLSVDDIKRKDMVAKAEHVDRSLAIVDYLRSILDMSTAEKSPDTWIVFTISSLIRSSWRMQRSMLKCWRQQFHRSAKYGLPGSRSQSPQRPVSWAKYPANRVCFRRSIALFG